MEVMRQERNRLAAEAISLAATADDDQGLAEARRIWKSASSHDRRAIASVVLYVVWAYLGITMALCVINVLSWLAEPGGPGQVSGTDPASANFCLLAISTGLAFITLFPMAAVTVNAVRSLRQAGTARKEFASLEFEAAARASLGRSSQANEMVVGPRCSLRGSHGYSSTAEESSTPQLDPE